MMRLPLGLNTRLPHEGCFSLQINAGLCAEMRFIKGILFSKTQFQNHYINELVLRFRDWLFFIASFSACQEPAARDGG